MQSRRAHALSRSVLGGLSAIIALGASPLRASAVAPSATSSRPEMELAFLPLGATSGANGALPQALVWDRPPRSLARAYRKLIGEVGPGWRASFDRTTGVARALFGAGLGSPGASSDATVAEALARAMLDRHIALLAPGATLADFDLVADDDDRAPRGDGLAPTPLRTVAFRQFVTTPSGVRLAIRGGQVSFRFKNDALVMITSEALPVRGLALDVPPIPASDAVTTRAAVALVERDFGASTATGRPSELFVLPYLDASQRLSFAVVRSVVVETEGVRTPSAGRPIARFEVFVDARSGRAIARRQLLHFDGSLALHVPDRSPSYGPRVDRPGILTDLTVDGVGNITDLAGTIPFSGAQADVIAFSHGSDVLVSNQAGAKAQIAFTLASGASYQWDGSADELVDAQLATFIHAREVREYAKSFAPGLSFLDEPVSANVNIADVCNAYSDGTVVNFFESGMGCENTGRIADVVYHEFGHSIHNHAIIPGVGVFEGALSEGIADYLAGTITGDHGMGRGFYFNSEPLRDLDPVGMENRWPDDLVGEVHEDGKIIGQALWDLRKALVTKLGDSAGVAHANYLFYEGIRRAVDIPSMYPEIIAADDDDGNLENGTPNVCEINAAFALHGLRPYSANGSALALEPVKQDGYTVTTALLGLYSQCPDDALTDARLKWRDEANPAGAQDIAMTVAGNQLSAQIPPQRAGTVVQYSISADFAGTSSILLPDNAADRWYQFYVGDVTPLYCTDFETDPAADGWVHGLSMGQNKDGADDWEWGVPKGTATNGDPTEAFSGKKVYGNDLGDLPNHDGLYQPKVTNFALSPVVDASGYDHVRLQYRRWLGVEDGHFDHATIYANDQVAWQNFDSNQGDASKVDHVDREWRFHDVDLTPFVVDGHVQVKFELASDPGKELGGWTLDDLCIVGVKDVAADPCSAGACGGGGTGGAPSSGNGLDDTTAEGACGCALAGGAPTAPVGIGALAAISLALLLRRRR